MHLCTDRDFVPKTVIYVGREFNCYLVEVYFLNHVKLCSCLMRIFNCYQFEYLTVIKSDRR